MNKIKKSIISTFMLFMLFAGSVMGQGKCTIKFFYELKPVTVYMDEKFQGIDVVQIDNVEAGSHYIKVLKDSIQIFGELVQVTEATPAIALVKNTPEVQKKLLESKYPQQLAYKANKVEILVSTRYVTQTTGGANSVTYPGYYVYNTKTQINTTTTTAAITDWKIMAGGTRSVSEIDLATMADLPYLRDRIQSAKNEENARSAQHRKQNDKIVGGGVIAGLSGLAMVGVSGYGLFKKPQPSWGDKYEDALTGVCSVGFLATVIGLGLSGKNPTPFNYAAHFISLDEASDAATRYNQKLKKSLGLPESYEP